MNKQNSFSNKTIEALKMAIEGMAKAEKVFDDLGLLLIKFGVNPSDINFHKESFLAPVIQVCKKALAETEKQEPVAWMNDKTPSGIFARHKEGANNFGCDIPLYTNPATWQSLSDDNILKLFKPKFECEIEDFELIDFARAIEQELKRKNYFNETKKEES